MAASMPAEDCVAISIENEVIENDASPLVNSSTLERPSSDVPLILILVGKCGSGKSSTANSLLGEKRFEALRSASSVTLRCQRATVSSVPSIEGKYSKVMIVDTPGLGDPEVSREDTLEEINKETKHLKEMYPNAKFVIVLVCGVQARISEDDLKEFGYLGTIFGMGFYRHTVMIWTHEDILVNVQDGLQGYFQRAGKALTSFMNDVQGGCMSIDNTDGETNSSKKDYLTQLVELAIPVAGSGRDIELKGKKARRQRQAELAKMRAASLENESLFGPLIEIFTNSLSSLGTKVQKVLFG